MVIAGCGSDEDKASSTPTPAATETAEAKEEGRFDVAFTVPVDVVRRLDEGNAQQLIREQGEVVASSDFGTETLWVTVDWLEKQGSPKVAKALEQLHPQKAKLAAFYDGWGGEDAGHVPRAGEAMLDWIRIFQEAAQAGGGDVVLIPDLH